MKWQAKKTIIVTSSYAMTMTMTMTMHVFRLIVRTSELLPLRGTVLEDSIPALKEMINSKMLRKKPMWSNNLLYM